jgi:murein DD-endopeptidase MepM/ murein hydrolase activator NlpD
MKKIFLILLITLPFYLLFSLYFLDKHPFLCPIEYGRDIVVRCDSRGNGLFAASRGNGSRMHEGIDLLAGIGTPVFAARSGMVIAATHSRGMGNYVIIRHPGNITTLYGHLSKIYVAKGQFLRQGQIIGAAGKTGNANSRDIQPHLHLEVRRSGVPEDPRQYLE